MGVHVNDARQHEKTGRVDDLEILTRPGTFVRVEDRLDAPIRHEEVG